MRICCLSVQTPAHVMGGMAQHTIRLSAALRQNGHDVIVVTTRHPTGLERGSEAGVPVHYVRDSVPGSSRGGWARASRACVAALGAQEPFDVLWSQGAAAAGVVGDLRRGRAPHLVAMIQGTSPQMVRSRLNALRAHGDDRELVRTVRRVAGDLARYAFVDPRVYRTAGAVIAVSEAVARSVGFFHRVSPRRVSVVPNGIDTTAFAFDPLARAAVRAAHALPPDAVVLLAVSLLTRQKGLDMAVETLARLRPRRPALALLVVGDGPARAELEARARARGVADAVLFAGSVAPERVASFYSAGDVFVFPTRRVEGFAHVIVEAMAAARPVVATRIGGNADAVADGQTGYLVDVDDLEGLTERVERLVTSATLRAELGRHGRERVEREFGVHRQAERFTAIATALVRGDA